jgi:hypothetical protein
LIVIVFPPTTPSAELHVALSTTTTATPTAANCARAVPEQQRETLEFGSSRTS